MSVKLMMEPHLNLKGGCTGSSESPFVKMPHYWKSHDTMPLVKSVYRKNNFLISQPKHMLWVLKRTVSMRLFFLAPKTHAKNYG